MYLYSLHAWTFFKPIFFQTGFSFIKIYVQNIHFLALLRQSQSHFNNRRREIFEHTCRCLWNSFRLKEIFTSRIYYVKYFSQLFWKSFESLKAYSTLIENCWQMCFDRNITRCISALTNITKGEDIPRHTSVETLLSTFFYKCFVCFQAFDRFSRHQRKAFHEQIFLPTRFVRIFVQPERFLKTPTSLCSYSPSFFC